MRTRATVAWMVLMAAGQLALAESGDMPKILYSFEDDPRPAWVAEELALDAHGEPDPELFASYAVSTLREYPNLERRREDGCIVVTEVFLKSSFERGDLKAELRSRSDFKSAVELADWIFIGRVTGISRGFHTFIPGSLVRLEPETSLKGPQDKSGAYFVFLPLGRVFLDNVELCKTDRRYPKLPLIGDRMLVMAELTPVNSKELLWIGENFAILKQDGTVAFPERFLELEKKLGQAASGGELEQRIRKVIEGGE